MTCEVADTTGRFDDEARGAARRELALAVALFLALTLLMTYPVWVHPATHVLWLASDTELFAWTLSWDAHAFLHRPWAIFDANIYHPERFTLAYSENLIGSAIFVAPVLWLTHNPVLAINLVGLLTCFLCAMGAYVLARRVGLGLAAGLLAGIVFAFSPPRLFRIGQLHLAAVQWLPFSLAFFHSYLDRRRARDLRWAVAFFTLQVLSSGHGAVFLLVSLVALAAYRLALGEPLLPARRIRDFGFTGALLALPSMLVVVAYRKAQMEVGLVRTLTEWLRSPLFGPDFVASPAYVHRWLIAWAGHPEVSEQASSYLFPGWLPLVLAAIAFLPLPAPACDEHERMTRRWRRVGVVLEVTAVVSLALALHVTALGRLRWSWGETVIFRMGDPWRAWFAGAICLGLRWAIARRAPFDLGARLRRGLAALAGFPARCRRSRVAFHALLLVGSLWLSIGPPLGVWRFVYWLPGFNFIRVPNRFTMLALLALGVLAGAGFDRLTLRLAWKGRAIAGCVAAALLVAELAAMPFNPVPWRVEIPAIDRWLATRPKPFVVAEVPIPGAHNWGMAERRQSTYMLHSMAHWQKTVHGFSGTRPEGHDRLFREMASFPDEASLRRLVEMGVNYVVVHTDLYPDGRWPVVESRINAFGPRLELLRVEGAGRVYRLR